MTSPTQLSRSTAGMNHIAGSDSGRLVLVPNPIGERLASFMLDKRTGNVVLNIRDGQILKAEFEEHVRAG